MAEAILGISAFYHDSAAALVVDGELIAAAQEERFSRKKHDAALPVHAMRYVLQEGAIGPGALSAVAFYEKPYLKLHRLLETYHAFAPKGLASFRHAMPVWMKEKLFIKQTIRTALRELGLPGLKILFPEHHLSHSASAFYPSPFEEAAILTIDGVGEWATTSIGFGQQHRIKVLRELHFPHSLGLLYSAFTYYLGFRVNGGEYKLMGLAPYGTAGSERVEDYKNKICNHLVDIRSDGSFLLNMNWFRFATGLKMTDDRKWEKLFGLPPRRPESAIKPEHKDLALAIQQVTEDILLRLARTTREITQCPRLALAGGVAMNSVANGKLLHSGIFEDIWIPPAPGDAGGAVGAALAAWHIWKGKPRKSFSPSDGMKGAFLGPEFSDKEIWQALGRAGASFEEYPDVDGLIAEVARLLSEGNVIGWFQGRMEFGPRALGNRSILADPRDPEMQKKLNLKVKKRESFRPFAPAVLEEDARQFFCCDQPSPYMQFVVPVAEGIRKTAAGGTNEGPITEQLAQVRSVIPAVTHVDYSARLQTVNRSTHPKLWLLLKAFKAITGYGVLINTSFNVRGEPIVCTPGDAYRCFRQTELDYLVIGNCLLDKKAQALSAPGPK